MDMKKALRIQQLRTGTVRHSLRRIAEIIEEEFPDIPELSGNQLYGSDLVLEAMEAIYGKSISEIEESIREEWDR